MMIGRERKQSVYMEDEHSDDVSVICEKCHKKQITRQGQPCIRCGHWWSRFWYEGD